MTESAYRSRTTPRYSERAAREAQVEAVRWLRAREAAAAARRGLIAGRGIAFTRGGHAELIPVEVPRAGRGQVTVRAHVSCVSPGTERARYLRLPNARGSVLSRPGYSMSGAVVEVGPGVDHVRAGDVVAVTDAPHTSVVTVDSSSVFAVPLGVPAAAAALVKLGVIAGQGVRIAGVAPGEELSVIGVGPIGALAQRLAVAAGGACVAAVGRSSSKEAVALAGGPPVPPCGRRRSGDRHARRAARDRTTGNPHAIPLAIRATGATGRIVLLGSPRGATPAVIDTTGRPGVLLQATRDLADGGVLVMAGEPLGRHLTIDLYPDIHRRGLQLVGVPHRALTQRGSCPPSRSSFLLRWRRSLTLRRRVAPGTSCAADRHRRRRVSARVTPAVVSALDPLAEWWPREPMRSTLARERR